MYTDDVDEDEGRSRGGHTRRRHRGGGGSPLLIIFPFSRVRSTDGSSAPVVTAVATVVVVVDKESEFFFSPRRSIYNFSRGFLPLRGLRGRPHRCRLSPPPLRRLHCHCHRGRSMMTIRLPISRIRRSPLQEKNIYGTGTNGRKRRIRT